MKDVYYYSHAGSINHGCEAIVRSTTKLLGLRPIIISNNAAGDEKYNINEIADVIQKDNADLSKIEKAKAKLLNSDKIGYKYKSKYEVRQFKPNSIALSIGGDNYCYGKEYAWSLNYINKELHKRNIKTILWGCSIEPSLLTKETMEDFARYDLIVARESISYEILKKCNDNTVLTCDPAFTLESEELPWPEGFNSSNVVGINISPLIEKSEENTGVVFDSYRKLVEYITNNTDYNIAFIPHVVQEGNNDLEVLRKLYDTVSEKNRACIIDDCNCKEIKGYISRCKLFVGARTHATIAAYSTGVPTLVMGYSNKAIGIAKDLFGSEENYVIPVQSIKSSDQIIEKFISLNKNKLEIRKHLLEKMPEYKKSVEEIAIKIKEWIDD